MDEHTHARPRVRWAGGNGRPGLLLAVLLAIGLTVLVAALVVQRQRAARQRLAEPATPGAGAPPPPDEVEEASIESFPASDAPGWIGASI